MFKSTVIAATACASWLCPLGLVAARAENPASLPAVALFVANQGQADGTASSVSVIDAHSLKVTATIPFGKAGPIFATLSPDKKFLWVTHYLDDFNTGGCDSSAVSVVNLVTMAIEASLNLPQCPNTLVFSPGGRFAYTMSIAGPISVIDTSKHKIVASITVSTGQNDIAISRDGRWLYAADAGDTNLTVVDTTTNKPARQIALNSAPFSIVLTPGGHLAFVATESNTDTFYEINLSAGTVLAMIPPVVGYLTNGLAVSPNGKILYDVDYDAQTLWLYSTYGHTQIGSITGFSYPIGIALSPEGDFSYVTNNNCAAFPCTSPGFVTVLSNRTHAVRGTITVGINPQFITAFP